MNRNFLLRTKSFPILDHDEGCPERGREKNLKKKIKKRKCKFKRRVINGR